MSMPKYSYIDDEMSRVVVIELKEPTSSEMTVISVECVVDVDDFREVAGLEILDLSGQMHLPAGAFVEPVDSSSVRLAYDESVDAMYVKLGRARAQNQVDADARLFLDANMRLVRIEVPISRV